MDPDEKKRFAEALNTYYKLKRAYEDLIANEKNKILKKRDLGWKEKRKLFVRLKPKCINCRRPVGSIFKTNKDGQDRFITAKCGDKVDPCKLNIHINLGYIMNINDTIADDEKDLTRDKLAIVKSKNDLIFGYITSQEAVEIFDKLKEEINSMTNIQEFSKELYHNTIDNKERIDSVKEQTLSLGKKILEVRQMVLKYENTQILQFITEAVQIYIDDILPMIKKLFKDKYASNVVEYDEDTMEYRLIQSLYCYSIEELEVDYGDKYTQGVISLEIGDGDLKAKKKTKLKEVVMDFDKVISSPDEIATEESEETIIPPSPLHDEEDDDEEYEEDEDDYKDEGMPKLKIYGEDVPIPKGKKIADAELIDASKATELGYKFEVKDGILIGTNPNNGDFFRIDAGK
jgi:hypothetical protein